MVNRRVSQPCVSVCVFVVRFKSRGVYFGHWPCVVLFVFAADAESKVSRTVIYTLWCLWVWRCGLPGAWQGSKPLCVNARRPLCVVTFSVVGLHNRLWALCWLLTGVCLFLTHSSPKFQGWLCFLCFSLGVLFVVNVRVFIFSGTQQTVDRTMVTRYCSSFCTVTPSSFAVYSSAACVCVNSNILLYD